jgi:N-acetylneuraminic acid mutarotase
VADGFSAEVILGRKLLNPNLYFGNQLHRTDICAFIEPISIHFMMKLNPFFRRSAILSGMLFLSLLFVASPASTQNAWTQKADFGGVARYWASGFSAGTKVYMGTGYNGASYNDFWEYNPATNVWAQKANYPGAGRLYVTGFSIGNKGYFGCGWNNGYMNDFWEYDPATNVWTQKANFPGVARWGAAGFSIGTKGYIGVGDAAGNGTGCQTDFYEYNPATNTWSAKASFPGAAVYGAASFSIGTKGYIGTGYGNGLEHKEFYEYDQVTNAWSQKADFGGTARYQDVGFSIGTTGYIGLGSTGTDFWAWDQATNTWSIRAGFPTGAVNVCVGVSVGGKGYVGTGQAATRQFYEYTPCSVNTPIVTPSGPTAICQGGSVTLSAPSGSSFAWSNSAITQSITTSTAGSYTVTVTDAQGCPGVSAATPVTVNALPNVTATASQPALCSGAMETLSGGGANSYVWNNGVTNNVPFVVNTSSPTTYNVTGTDANGCSNNSASVSLVVNPLPNVVANTSASAVCQGGSVTLTGGGANSYVWNNGALNGVSFVPAGSQTYSVTGTDNNGCSNSASVSLVVNLLPNVVANASAPAVCQGGSVTLTGGGANSYVWNNGALNGVSFVPAGSQTYSVTGTDNNGCINSASVSLVVNPLPNVVANTSASAVCQGGSVTLTGGGANSYVWNNGALNGVSFVPAGSQTYSVTGTDNNGCNGTATTTVTVNPLPTVSMNLGSLDTVCFNGGLVNLIGGSPSGGTYSGTGVSANVFDPSAAGLGSFIITYEFTDANNCANTAIDTVMVMACTGVGAGLPSFDLAIYPNPFEHQTTLEFSRPVVIVTLKLCDVFGRELREMQFSGQRLQLDKGTLAKGVYFVRVIDENSNVLTKRIVVQ